MNPPYEPHPARRPTIYMLAKSHEFTCLGCEQKRIGESPNVKYCKALSCQRTKVARIAERRRKRERRAR